MLSPMRAAIIRGGDVDLTVLVDVLRQVSTNEIFVLGNSFGDSRLFDPMPDLAVGILSPPSTDSRSQGFTNLDVMLRMGMLVQHSVPALLIVPPLTWVLSPARGLAVAYSALDNSEALRFHVTAIAAQIDEGARLTLDSVGPRVNTHASEMADYLAGDPSLSPTDFEILLRSLLESGGARAMVSTPTDVTRGAVDLVALLPDTANGLVLIQAKTGTSSKRQLAQMESTLYDLVVAQRASLGLLIYYDRENNNLAKHSATPLTLSISLKELVAELTSQSLEDVLLNPAGVFESSHRSAQ